MQKVMFILTLFFYYSPVAQTPDSAVNDLSDEPAPYVYNTILKGGYTILFKADDSLQYLYLKKDNKIIAELSSCSRGLLNKNLGYVTADFKDYFVLAHSFGSGNPHNIELIRKTSGKNILNGRAAWIDALEDIEMLLYSENDVPGINDKMTLLNVRTGQKQFFGFPPDIFNEPEVLNRIGIDKLFDNMMVIKYETANGLMLKIYTR